jgi:uncharacterized phage-associated protein
MPTAIDVAKHFLRVAQAELDEPEPLTHMRLQKLLYYVQGWALAFRGDPLFRGRLEAWRHGPVAPEAYQCFRRFGDQPIPWVPFAAEPCELSDDDKALIDSVWQSYKVYSAPKLRQMTHQERPWLEARGDREPDENSGGEISQATMLDFFRQQYARQAMPGLGRENLERAAEDFRAGRVSTLEQLEAEFGGCATG